MIETKQTNLETTMKRKLSIFSLIVVSLLLLGGCGQDNTAVAEATAAAAAKAKEATATAKQAVANTVDATATTAKAAVTATAAKVATAATTATSNLGPIPATHMAIVQGDPDADGAFAYKSVPVPTPGEGEVLIRVIASAINPIDRRSRAGGGGGRPAGAAGGMGGPPGAGGGGMGGPPGGGGGGMGGPPGAAAGPSIPGVDVAGVVAQLGAGVTNMSVGDPVFSKLAFGGGGLNGGYAEYAVAPASNTYPKPADQTYAEASGLGTVGVTALRTIKHADVKAGQRVFINGIGGGIGSSAAQFALERGATVLGTASAKHHAYLKSIGVSRVVNYREEQFDEVITEPVDVVIETVGTETATQAVNILKAGGKLVSIAGPADATKCEEKGVDCSRIGGEFGWPNSEMMAEVSRLAAAGAFRLNVDTTFPLNEAEAAQDLNFNVGTSGKVVLIVDADMASQK